MVLKGNYLVLGSTGLMGSHALLALRDKDGVQVRAVYNRRQPHIFGGNIAHVKATLLNRGACRRVMQAIDYVLMFAGILSTAPVIARDPVAPVMTNLLITSQSLEAAYYADIKKFVWLSSTTGYPPIEGKLHEDQMFEADPPDVYYPVGWMTRYLETQCRMYAEKLKRPMVTVTLRPTLAYGEYDDFRFETGHFLPAFIRRVVERQDPLEVWGTGEQARDLIYVGDVVEASLLALERIDRYETFNIAYGKSYTVNELLDKIIAIDNYVGAKVVHLTDRPTTVSKRLFDNRKAREELGFVPKTTIEDGIRRAIDWYRQTTFGKKKL